MSATRSPRPLRILVVDDDPAMVGAITALVGTEGHQVVTAYDGLTAERRYREERPDIILLDLAMPGPDGFSVIGRIRALGSTPVIVVSGESDEKAKVRALGLGADDYLTKPFGRQELLARVSAVMRRATPSVLGGDGAAAGASPLLRSGALELDPRRHESRVGSTPLELTPIEHRLLEALLAAGGGVVNHDRLLRAGWPTESDPDPLWLKSHLARLRAKLAAAEKASGEHGGRVEAVRGVGYRIEAPRA